VNKDIQYTLPEKSTYDLEYKHSHAQDWSKTPRLWVAAAAADDDDDDDDDESIVVVVSEVKAPNICTM